MLDKLAVRPVNRMALTAKQIFAKHAEYDNRTWSPAYGVPSRQVSRAITLAQEANIKLDPTFSGKAFTTLVAYGESGRLKGKQAIFWNTHHRFAFNELPGFQQLDLHSLPEPLFSCCGQAYTDTQMSFGQLPLVPFR